MVRSSDGEVVRLSPSNWIAIVLFFGTQTVALLGAGIGMYTRLMVLEEKFATQREVILEIKEEVRQIKLARLE